MFAAAVQAVMDEPVGQFVPYAESGVPTFGRDDTPSGGLDPSNLRRQTFGGADSATTSSTSTSTSSSSAGDGAEIVSKPYAHIDPGLVGSLAEWGRALSKLALSGVGTVV